MRVRDDFERIPVKETLTLVTVLPCGVVLAVLTNTTADPTAGLVHGHVKVASARVAIAVTPWKQNKQRDISWFLLSWSCHHCCPLLSGGYLSLIWLQCSSNVVSSQVLCFTAKGKQWRFRTELGPTTGPYNWEHTRDGKCAWHAVGNTAPLKRDLAEYFLQILIIYSHISYITHFWGNK